MTRKLRVAIDCRITDPRQGVGTAVLALAKVLSDSTITDQEYTFVIYNEFKDWLAPYVHGPCKLHTIPRSASSAAKAAFRWIRPLRSIWRRLLGNSAYIPTSDGYVESEHFDVVHFPTQTAYLTKLPTIYQPWDLQHLHYPDFFSKAEFVIREKYYRAFCSQASIVCVQAEWTKRDVIRQYGMTEEKIVVIPWGSVFDAYRSPSEGQIRATIDKYQLPTQFFFYPAATWPHKNHEAILRSLHILKSEYGITPHVFFTGASTDHYSTLCRLGESLHISEQLHFLGFVAPVELQAIFATATAMIFPSKFEGFGLPILEAFHARLPVISSDATTLPEVARDAALYFDPDSPKALSALMRTVLKKPELRHDMIQKGLRVLSQYSIRETAANFQALYFRIAGFSSGHHELVPSSHRADEKE